jgi:hypothetical protein
MILSNTFPSREWENMPNICPILGTQWWRWFWFGNISENIIDSIAWQTGMPASSAQDATKLLHLHLFKATVVHKFYSTTWSKAEVCELMPTLGACWRKEILQFFCLSLNLVNVSVLHEFSEQQVSHFNPWKCHYMMLLLVCGVCYAVSTARVTGPILLYQTIHAKWYATHSNTICWTPVLFSENLFLSSARQCNI